IIDTSKNVELRYFNGHETHKHEEEIHHENKDVDPHIWLSPIQVKKQVDTITKSLSEIDPNNSQIYYNNSKEFKEKLDLLDSKIRSIFNETKTKKIMVFHPAWGYFTDEYGLEQIIIEESGKEPTAKKLQQIINHGKEENIKFIFVQSQFNKDVAESIAEEIDAVTISIDPLSENYIENLEKIAIKIKESLN
ncbi:MAG: metal ABC transporter solute-binding protein, Zn/Mn family, partial [Candidatus Woesearchaeota archaeon]